MLKEQAKRAAVFLDRDGTVIVDVGYPRDPRQVQLIAGAGSALRTLQQEGFTLVLVSNQSGIGRGWVKPDEAEQVHAQVVASLEGEGVHLDGAYYCPHAPEAGCACRKPSPGMLLRAAQELDLDLSRSFMVGDRASDIEAGKQAGCRGILLRPDSLAQEGSAIADMVVPDWRGVVSYIVSGK
jgi:D,D-heptose 1,7-bisphosphate phosphatase